MKISIINGSPRPDGSTAKILKEIHTELLKKDAVEVTYVNLAELEMKFCKGCIRCYGTGRCIIADDGVEAVVEQIKQADGIILGSPTYASNISGYSKNFMDRSHCLLDQTLHNKYGFVVATYEIADGKIVRNMLRKFFQVSGALVRGEFTLKLGFNRDPWANRTARTRLHRQIERFYRAIRQQEQKTWFERLFSHVLVHIIWKPIFLGQPQKYAGVLASWRQKGLLTTETTSVLSPLVQAVL